MKLIDYKTRIIYPFTFLIVKIKLDLATNDYLLNEEFTFLIVKIKLGAEVQVLEEYDKFTFLIVKIKPNRTLQ